MKLTDFFKKMPAGSPAAEILKIFVLIAGTVLVDSISDIVKESIGVSEASQYIDIKSKESE